MKHSLKHKLLLCLAVAGFLASFTLVAAPASVFAAAGKCNNPQDKAFDSSCCPSGQSAVEMQGTHSCCPTAAVQGATTDGAKAKACLFGKYLNPVINLLTAVVGVVVVIGIIVGAIQFSSSAGDPQKAANGKNHIRNALIGLLAYILLYAFLQFVIPGGRLN
jgi:hypothetical protein